MVVYYNGQYAGVTTGISKVYWAPEVTKIV
jgi:hypothetical protein